VFSVAGLVIKTSLISFLYLNVFGHLEVIFTEKQQRRTNTEMKVNSIRATDTLNEDKSKYVL